VKFWVRFLATFGYVGEFPAGPGTAASAVAAVIAWYGFDALPWIAGGLTLAGFLLTFPAERAFDSKDPGKFVIDEVCGMMVSVLWLPKTLPFFIAAFVLFRIFDIFKPWPVGRLDRMKHPSGILWDDLAAGVLTNAILQIVHLAVR
jgi:phosphatidylglycerophosphatase A